MPDKKLSKWDEKVSVVVITRNRYKYLTQCLVSLLAQTNVIDELIVIDNHSSDRTKEITFNIQRNTSIPLRYVLEKKIGYPFARNRGLKEAKYQWVAFIDDDCVVDEQWFQKMKQSINKNGFAAAITGRCKTYHQHNLFSLVHHSLNEYWKAKARKGHSITDLETLDTKNIVFNARFLIRHNLKFDVTRSIYGGGISEDCDLGMSIQQVGGKACYCSEMLVYHQDPTNLKDYLRKLFFSTSHHLSYEKKWQQFRKKIPINPVNRINFFSTYLANTRIGLFSGIVFYLLLGCSVLYIKIFYKIKI